MKSQRSIRTGLALLCVMALSLGGFLFTSAQAFQSGDEVLFSWQELQSVSGEEVLLTGKQLRAADTGEQYTMFYLPSGEEAPADFIIANQRRWSVESVSVEAETPAADPTKETAAQQVPAALAVSSLIVDVPEPDRASLLEEDKQATLNPATKSLYRIGVDVAAVCALDLATLPPSLWQPLADGGSALAVVIEAPGAFGQRVHLQDLALPEGASVLARNAENPAECPEVLTSEALGVATDYWLGTVFSSRVQVEFRLPEGADPAALSCRIAEVNYVYRDPVAQMLEMDAAEKVGYCHKDVTCYSDWSSTNRAVARISFKSGTASYLCTGTLLNDKDTATVIPYFLTAHHCLSTQTEAGTIEFYWLYQTSSCNGSVPSLTSVPRTTGGATLLATQSSNDFSFLRIKNNPPSGLTYAGWTTTSPTSSETITGIHHPGGSYKRISFGKVVSSTSSVWTVRWSSGTTEQGSSGSGLFNSSRLLVGQLWRGSASCDNMSGTDDYGRFNVTYPLIQSWIASGGSTPSVLGEVKEMQFSHPIFSDLRCSAVSNTYYLGSRSFKFEMEITKADVAGIAGLFILNGLPISGRTSAPLTSGSVSYNKKLQQTEIRFRASGRDPLTKESYQLDFYGYRSGNYLVLDPTRTKLTHKLVYPTKQTYKVYFEGVLDLKNSSYVVKVLDLNYTLVDAKKRLYRTSSGYVSLPWGETTGVSYSNSPQTRSERKSKTGVIEQRRKYQVKGDYTRAANIQVESDWYDPNFASSLPVTKYKVQSYKGKGDQKDTSLALGYKGYPLPAAVTLPVEPEAKAEPLQVVRVE